MRSPWTLNLILAALIVVLGTFLYFKPGARQSAAVPLTLVKSEVITRVRIDRPGQVPIALEQLDGAWHMQSPISARANVFNVEELLGIVSADSTFQTAASADSLSTYGLDNPTLRVTFNDDEIAVGSIHPMKQQHYVRYRDTVHLVSTQKIAPAFRDYPLFIDTKLFTEQQPLAALRLSDFQLRLENGTWRREPPDEKISADQLNQFIAEWENASALSMAKLAPDKSTLASVQATFQNGHTVTLDVLSYKPEFVIARRELGLEYHFPEEIGKRLTILRALEP